MYPIYVWDKQISRKVVLMSIFQGKGSMAFIRFFKRLRSTGLHFIFDFILGVFNRRVRVAIGVHVFIKRYATPKRLIVSVKTGAKITKLSFLVRLTSHLYWFGLYWTTLYSIKLYSTIIGNTVSEMGINVQSNTETPHRRNVLCQLFVSKINRL